ncbi:MAG: hypothetical protein WD534_15210 [Phycisphaeraceae bacterium]
MTRGRPPKCIHCGSQQSIAKGYRETRTLGTRQLRLCKACGRKFTPRYQRRRDTSKLASTHKPLPTDASDAAA